MTDQGSPATAAAWLRGRRVRRAVTVGAVPVWGGLLVLSLTADGAENDWPWLVLLAVFLLLWVSARAAGGDIAEGRPDRLDERETEIRLRLSRTGFVAAVGGSLAAALYLLAVQDQPVLLARAGALLLTLAVGTGSVPTFLWCWSAEDVDDVDD